MLRSRMCDCLYVLSSTELDRGTMKSHMQEYKLLMFMQDNKYLALPPHVFYVKQLYILVSI